MDMNATVSAATINEWSHIVIGAALHVHRSLGPGLLEHVYRSCLAFEIRRVGLRVATEVPLAITFGELLLPNAYRLDILVEGVIIVEVKAVEKVLGLHFAQLLTYLKLGNKPLGLLINFNSVRLADGIKRIANNL
jgi:GxxExxY protein